MSDDTKIERPGAQDEPADEVEGHGRPTDKVARPAVSDEGDEVEAHIKLDAPRPA